MLIKTVNRRDFLKTSLYTVGVAGIVPQFLFRSKTVLGAIKDNDNILVIVQLTGGNDGLNTVIPYTNDIYFRSRPRLKLDKSEWITVNDEIALNSSLSGIKNLYDNGNVALIQGVGYPNPNRSHFRSMDIWHSASDSDEYLSDGWLGRYMHLHGGEKPDPMLGININSTISPAMKNKYGIGVAFEGNTRGRGGQSTRSRFAPNRQNGMDIQEKMIKNEIENRASNLDFIKFTQVNALHSRVTIEEAARNYRSLSDYPQTQLGRRLRLIAAGISENLPARIYYTSFGSFDTHANQRQQHFNLLQQFSSSLSAFQNDIEKQGFADRVTVLTFSEFGRRVSENGSNGTDHGTAAPMFVIGSKVNGGIYGSHPDLSDLDEGDLKFNTDFRSVYASLLENWLNADSEAVLGRKFKKLRLL